MVDHRNLNHHAEQQFKVFNKILKEHCEEVNIKEDKTIEILDSNSEIIAEVDYYKKKVLCENTQIEDHLNQLLDIHHHSCMPMDSC